MKKIIVIGGGAAGMMAAIHASIGNEVILIEKNEKLGKKLYITGKGRCNITNAAQRSDFFEGNDAKCGFDIHSSPLRYFSQKALLAALKWRPW